jgi:hypothetical protein
MGIIGPLSDCSFRMPLVYENFSSQLIGVYSENIYISCSKKKPLKSLT